MASLASKIAPHGLQLELAEGPFVDGDKTLMLVEIDGQRMTVAQSDVAEG